MSATERPFHCGTQYMDWEERNCCQCIKGVFDPDDDGVWRPKCDIQEELSRACLGDGTVSVDIAERMGLIDNKPPRQEGFSYIWDCKERVE